MSTIESTNAEAITRLEEALKLALSGKRDRQAMLEAGKRMDERRERNLQKYGIQDIAVELIRDARQ